MASACTAGVSQENLEDELSTFGDQQATRVASTVAEQLAAQPTPAPGLTEAQVRAQIDDVVSSLDRNIPEEQFNALVAAVGDQIPEGETLTEEQLTALVRAELDEIRTVITETLAAQTTIEPIPGVDTGGCTYVLWTYVKNSAGILFDFEAQSEVTQMNDFWIPGSETILVLERSIAPNERSAYEEGWGTAWAVHGEDREGCEEFDPIENAVEHAQSRLDQGHAGLVVDFRSEITATVVAHVEGMTEAYAEDLWDMYIGQRHDGGRAVPQNLVFADDVIVFEPPAGVTATSGVTTTVGITSTTGVTTSGAVTTTLCGGAERAPDFAGGIVGPFDEVAVIQPWGTGIESATGENQIAVVLDIDQTFEGFGQQGGAVWNYPGCNVQQATNDAVANGGLPVYLLEEDELVSAE